MSPFSGFLLGLHIAPLLSLVDIHQASVIFLFLDSAYQLPLVFALRHVSRVPCYLLLATSVSGSHIR